MEDTNLFWRIAVGYLYGWWPYVPLTLVLAIIGAVIAGVMAHGLTEKFDKQALRNIPGPWRWPGSDGVAT